MSGHHSKNNEMNVIYCSRPCLERLEIGIKLTALYTKCTCYGYLSWRCRMPHIDRDINLQVEDAETTGIDNDNESISGLDTTVALGGLEAEGNSV